MTKNGDPWGKFQTCVPTDHNGFVVHAPLGLDQIQFYRDVVARKDGL